MEKIFEKHEVSGHDFSRAEIGTRFERGFSSRMNDAASGLPPQR
jgi:hypothetical protein